VSAPIDGVLGGPGGCPARSTSVGLAPLSLRGHRSDVLSGPRARDEPLAGCCWLGAGFGAATGAAAAP